MPEHRLQRTREAYRDELERVFGITPEDVARDRASANAEARRFTAAYKGQPSGFDSLVVLHDQDIRWIKEGDAPHQTRWSAFLRRVKAWWYRLA